METEVFEDINPKEKLSYDNLKTLGTRFKKTKRSNDNETDNDSFHSAKLSKEDYKALEDKYKTVVPTGQGWYHHPRPSGHGGSTCFGILFKDSNWVTVKDFGYVRRFKVSWQRLPAVRSADLRSLPPSYSRIPALSSATSHTVSAIPDQNFVTS